MLCYSGSLNGLHVVQASPGCASSDTAPHTQYLNWRQCQSRCATWPICLQLNQRAIYTAAPNPNPSLSRTLLASRPDGPALQWIGRNMQ